MKRNRNYILYVQDLRGETLKIELPFTLEFDIQRNNLAGANNGNLTVYNLSKINRDRIRKDLPDMGKVMTLRLEAGYGRDMATVLSGYVKRAYSVRQGVDFLTNIEVYDGGYALANAFTSVQYQKGTANNVILKDLVGKLKPFGVQPGAVGDFPGTIKRGNSYSGPVGDLLKEVSGNAFFIDNNRAFVMGENETIAGSSILINADTGLLGTPVREQAILTIEMLFEPKVYVNQMVQVESRAVDVYNGTYKVVGIHHSGTISEAVSGKATTRLSLFVGTKALSSVELLG